MNYKQSVKKIQAGIEEKLAHQFGEKSTTERCVLWQTVLIVPTAIRIMREFSKLIGFLVVSLVAVGLVFNADGVKRCV